jgi:hypothetical protein
LLTYSAQMANSSQKKGNVEWTTNFAFDAVKEGTWSTNVPPLPNPTPRAEPLRSLLLPLPEPFPVREKREQSSAITAGGLRQL